MIRFPGGRRFTLAGVVIVMAYVSLWTGTMSDAQAAVVVLGALGFYAGANTYEAVKRNGHTAPPAGGEP